MLQPELFDIVGVISFLFIIVISIRALGSHNTLPQWMFIVLLLIGIAGLFVDGAIVYTFFLS